MPNHGLFAGLFGASNIWQYNTGLTTAVTEAQAQDATSITLTTAQVGAAGQDKNPAVTTAQTGRAGQDQNPSVGTGQAGRAAQDQNPSIGTALSRSP